MQQNVLEFTKKLIAIPSDVNDREACLQILETTQKELSGFSFTPFASNGVPSVLYTNTPSPTKKCKIIFYAHLDVVPGSKEQFIPVEKNGKLYGRGAYDMKAASAAIILLFKEIAHQLPYTLGLQLTTDEEVVGFNGVGYQLAQGVTAEFAIAGECGSSLRIVNQLRGLNVVKLQASGVEAHAGHSWHGENALLKIYEAIHNILQEYPTPATPSWQTTVSVANVATENQTHNIVPDNATALLDIRPIPEDKERILEKIQQLLPEGVTMEVIKTMPSLHTKETNEYLQKLKTTLEDITKQPATIAPSYAGSDIIFFSMNNINGIEFGPVGGGHHSKEEWVDIKGLQEYYQILKHFLLSIK